MRGQGRIYKQKDSKNYWVAFYAGGKERRFATGTDKKKKALEILDEKKAEFRTHGTTFRGDKVTLREMFDAVLRDYDINDLRSKKRIKICIGNLLGVFDEKTKAVHVTKDTVAEYIASRKKDGVSNATINREVAALRHAFHLAHENEILVRVPHFRMLAEPPPPDEFLTRDQYQAVRNHLAYEPALQDLVDCVYCTGWRESEIRELGWDEIDMERGVVTLQARRSKTKRKREIPIGDALREVIQRRLRARHLRCPFVFHRNGKQIKNWDTAKRNAKKAAGFRGKKVIHALRKTMARDLIDSGVDEQTACEQLGHATNSTFRRYRITTKDNLKDAAAKVETHRKAQRDASGPDSRIVST